MNTREWLLAAAFDWAAIALAVLGVSIARQWDTPLRFGAYALAAVVVGCRQHALAVLGHEAAHHLVAKNSRVNDALGDVVCFAPLGASVGAYRLFHFAHHDYLGTAEDPEYRAKGALATLGDTWVLPATKGRFLRELLLSLSGLRFYMALFVIGGMFPRRPRGLLTLAAVWVTILVVLYLSGAWWVLALWAGSLGTAFWAAFWLRTWTEHVGTPDTHRVTAAWWQRFLFLPHNTWCHWEHHNNPALPFWRLPSAREHSPGGNPAVSLGDLWNSFGVGPVARSYEPRPAADQQKSPVERKDVT